MRRGMVLIPILVMLAFGLAAIAAGLSPANLQDLPSSADDYVPDHVIAAAGDIACDSNSPGSTTCRQLYTSNLLVRGRYATVLTLGDNQYESGSLSDFQAYFSPTWGRVKPSIKPAPGNHEYETRGAAGYYDYFGPVAGDRDKGYYSYDVGSWHIIALNSSCDDIGGCDTGSAQEMWLKADLAANSARCTLAYWHHPRFSSGDTHGSDSDYDAFWRALYADGADVVLNGHEHNYERFAPQNPSGVADSLGIRQFVAGTGGKSHYGFGSPIANSQVRNSDTFGILQLTLRPRSYDWRFVPEAGKSFTDKGRWPCH